MAVGDVIWMHNGIAQWHS